MIFTPKEKDMLELLKKSATEQFEALKNKEVSAVELTKASSKGVYHKNTVSRKISRLSKAVNAMA